MRLGRVRQAVERRSQPAPPPALSAASRAVLAAWHGGHRHWRLWSASLPPFHSGTVWSSSNGSGVPGVMSISLPQPLQFGPSLSQMRSLASCLALPRSRCVAPIRGACCIRVAWAMVMRWAAAAMRGRAPIFNPLCSLPLRTPMREGHATLCLAGLDPDSSGQEITTPSNHSGANRRWLAGMRWE